MDTNNVQSFAQKNMKWIIILAVVVVIALWLMGKYNFFINTGEQVTAQWAQVENQLQRRFDLIPNVEATVKGDAKQEKDIIATITQARTQYAGAQTVDQKAVAATQVETGLGRLLAVVESYPAHNSEQSFRDLTTELEGTENRIAVERMKYNDLVRAYDTNVKTFPGSLIAKMFGFTEKAYFNVPESNQVVPKVDFTN